MRLYGPYSGERTLSVFANLRGFQPEDYKAFLDNEQFADVMNSLVIDPNGYHEPGTTSENGFTTDRGQIASYTGSDTALEIPARIGQFDSLCGKHRNHLCGHSRGRNRHSAQRL